MTKEEEHPQPPSVAGPAAGSRRERRRQEIRDRLYETAIELFLAQGYDYTTIDEIAERADCARATVFNHFPRKIEFLLEWGARRRANVATALHRSHLDDEPVDVVLASYMRLSAQLNEEHRSETKEFMPAALAHSLSNSPMASIFADYLLRAQERQEVRDGVEPSQAGAMLAATYFTTIIRWADHDPPAFDLVEALTTSASLLIQGIKAPDNGRNSFPRSATVR